MYRVELLCCTSEIDVILCVHYTKKIMFRKAKQIGIKSKKSTKILPSTIVKEKKILKQKEKNDNL